MGEPSREARPEGCVVVAAAAARRREGCVQPVREPGALASVVCGVTRLGSGWGGTPGWVFVSGAALGGGAGAGQSCSGSRGTGGF